MNHIEPELLTIREAKYRTAFCKNAPFCEPDENYAG